MNNIIILADKIAKQKDKILNEESTKISLILPFLQILGYDIFNPEELIAEYSCDYGVKRGEKVDFAICTNNKIDLIIECKNINTNFSSDSYNQTHNQLFRYFSVTESKFAILTNGIQYLFFTDATRPNLMDNEPFFIFNVLNFSKHDLDILSNFSRWNINREFNLNINGIIILKEKDIINEPIKFGSRVDLFDYLNEVDFKSYLYNHYKVDKKDEKQINEIENDIKNNFIKNKSLIFLYRIFINKDKELDNKKVYKAINEKLGDSYVKRVDGISCRVRYINKLKQNEIRAIKP